MLSIALPIAVVMIAAALALCLWRLLHGPSVADRVLALDTLTINSIALIILYGIATATSSYFEAALLVAMMGFVGTVALCKFAIGGDVID